MTSKISCLKPHVAHGGFIKNMRKLKRNAIKCNHCGDVIESTSVHDFKWCSCKMVAVDGGKAYTRRLFTNSLEDFEELSEWEDEG